MLARISSVDEFTHFMKSMAAQTGIRVQIKSVDGCVSYTTKGNEPLAVNASTDFDADGIERRVAILFGINRHNEALFPPAYAARFGISYRAPEQSGVNGHHRETRIEGEVPRACKAKPPEKSSLLPIDFHAAAQRAVSAFKGLEQKERDAFYIAYINTRYSLLKPDPTAALKAREKLIQATTIATHQPPGFEQIRRGMHFYLNYHGNLTVPNVRVCFFEEMALVMEKGPKRESLNPGCKL